MAQITVTMKHAGMLPPWGHPVYVRGIVLQGRRPCILTQERPCETDATPAQLDAILSEIVTGPGRAFTGYRIETSDRFAHVED